MWVSIVSIPFLIRAESGNSTGKNLQPSNNINILSDLCSSTSLKYLITHMYFDESEIKIDVLLILSYNSCYKWQIRAPIETNMEFLCI